jgi:hypothetical protein
MRRSRFREPGVLFPLDADALRLYEMGLSLTTFLLRGVVEGARFAAGRFETQTDKFRVPIVLAVGAFSILMGVQMRSPTWISAQLVFDTAANKLCGVIPALPAREWPPVLLFQNSLLVQTISGLDGPSAGPRWPSGWPPYC